MTIRTEFEKDGRWVATIPEVPGARGHGSTRLEAATGAAADALLILKNESEEIWKANLEALEKSARAGAAGATSLLSRQRELLQDTLREVADMAQSYRAPGNPQELMAKQTEFARKSFEAALKNAGEVAELARKSGTESIEILRERIKEAMQEIRAGYGQK